MKNVKISDYLWFQEGPGVRNTQYTTSGVKLINVANLVDGNVDLSTSDRYISEEEAYGKYNHFLADDGDFVIASSGIKIDYFDKKMGFIKKEHLPLCMNTSCIRFKVLNTNNLEIKYFMYYLKSNSFKKQLFNQITGSAQLNFGPSHLKKMTFPLIELKDQKIIIERLDKTQDIINETKALLSKYDTLIKSRFIEMFGDPVQNPMGWEVKKLGKMCSAIMNGTTPKGGEQVYVENGITFLRSQNVWRNKIDLEDVAYIDEATHKSMKKSSLKKYDILMTKTGRINTENSSLGRAALFLGEDDSANINGHVYLIRLEKEYNHEFVIRILTSPEYRDYIRSVCVGGIDKRQVNKDHIEEFPIIQPPIELQDGYSAFVQQIDKSKFAVQKSLEKAETLYKSLMQEYFG